MSGTPSKETDANSSLNRTLTPVRVLDSPRVKATVGIESNLAICRGRLDTIFKTLQEDYATWCSLEQKGLRHCQLIESTKIRALKFFKGVKMLDDSVESKDQSLYPNKLSETCKALRLLVHQLKEISENSFSAWKQATALANLPGCKDHVVYRSWSMSVIVEFLLNIKNRYNQEIQIKQHVMENISHCWCSHDLIRYATAWEFPQFIDDYVRLLFAILAEEIRK